MEILSQCRLCGEQKSCQNSVNISIADDLVLKIHKLLPVVVLVGDPLPQDVCVVCKEKLEAFNLFYDLTAKTEFSLKSALNLSPQSPLPVKNPLIHFNYLQPKPLVIPPPKVRILEKTFNKTRLYSCLDCTRAWVSEKAAINHACSARLNVASELNGQETERSNDLKSATPVKKADTSGAAVQNASNHTSVKDTNDIILIEDNEVSESDGKQKNDVKVVGISHRTEVQEDGVPKPMEKQASKRNEQNNNGCNINYSVKVNLSKANEAITHPATTKNKSMKITTVAENTAKNKDLLSHDALRKGVKSRQKRPRSTSSTVEELKQWKRWKGGWTGKETAEESATPDYSSSEPEPFACDLCGKSFEFRAELTLHAAVHKGHMGSANGTCDTDTALRLVADAQAVGLAGETSDNIHRCSFCDLSFKRKATLVSHVQTHIEKSFDVCWSDDGT